MKTIIFRKTPRRKFWPAYAPSLGYLGNRWQMEEDWKTHLSSIRVNLRPSEALSARGHVSIPRAAQKYFFDALGLLWLLELRICFQNAVKDENISKYIHTLRIGLTRDNLGRYGPMLTDAIVKAANTGKQIKELRNFNSGWDLQRFIRLIKTMQNHNPCPVPRAKDMVRELECWNAIRNEKAHDDLSVGERRVIDDDELSYRIENSRPLLPRINSLKPTSAEAKRIADKLNELQACLDGEEVTRPNEI